MQIIESIANLKEEKNAIILAHNYVRGELQDIADVVGDSLELARSASATDASVIVFCGVDFMAETASILNPDKKVLIPDIGSICPMAQMLMVEDLIEAKKAHPDAKVVLYVNTLAEAKVHADCICTSANADRIVNAMESDTILFGPDINLGNYVRKHTDKKIIPVPAYGLCPTHHQITLSDLIKAKKAHPGAEVVVHPECVEEVQDMADQIASTSGMVKYCKHSDADEFLIGTEVGLIYRMKKEMPDKKFYPVSESAVCPQMKMHTLEKVERALREEIFEVKVPEMIQKEAIKPIMRMLDLSK
ncbi:MAG: Quinolinate synthetase A [Candidatus Syntrophoarchaeum caldarius]|uniref:Quinolinate synthase n=1 Tax=Candidatus Syntropharchaeum caldarium TaxID=1838285 RepID=A0A1F2PAM2_9EURY|nr:MAG: Quinolinate synthetase A [Candidatus Syntrophoarchaeum caldarius]